MNSSRGTHEGDRKGGVWHAAVGICLIVLCLSVVGIVRTLWVSEREKGTFDELVQMAEVKEDKQKPADLEDKNAETEADEAAPQRDYGKIKAMNEDFAGWLRIEDTKMDYPVMHTPEDMQYYIRRDFYGKSSVSGTPFIGDNCNVDSMSMIVYGHNMKNGTMFGDLDLYESKKYWEKHPILEFSTPEETRKYEIFAAFRTQLVKEEIPAGRYYQYAGDLTEEAYSDFISQLKQVAYYDTDCWPEYGDQLIMLSTCSYHAAEGRFVIVAKRVE